MRRTRERMRETAAMNTAQRNPTTVRLWAVTSPYFILAPYLAMITMNVKEEKREEKREESLWLVLSK